MPLDISCHPGFYVEVTANPTKLDGSAARLDGAVSGALTSGNGANPIPGASDKAVQLEPASGAAIGDVIVFTLSADADLGTGIRSLEDVVTMTVTAEPEEEAQALGLTAGTPQRR